MILHILKLIRKRLGSNLWILAELFIVFMILWVTVDYFQQNYVLMNRPVGFRLDRVYRVMVSQQSTNSPSFIPYEAGSTEPRENYLRLLSLLERHPDVEAVSVSSFSLPYDHSNSWYGVTRDSVNQNARLFKVSPNYFRVFGIQPVSGGEPERLSERLTEKGMISSGLAQTLFGRTDVVGREFFYSGDTVPVRITAVTEYLRASEIDNRSENATFTLLDPNTFGGDAPNETELKNLQLCFRIRPGVAGGPDYAEHFLREMKQQLRIGNYWVSNVRSYEEIRTNFLKSSMEMNERKIFSVLSVFFLVNVFLAVIGTFWFHVVRRRSEMGLRMAIGSRRQGIKWLMMGEGLLLLTIATLPVVIIFANMAYMDLFVTKIMPMSVMRFLSVTLGTWCTLALVIILAIWYPARKASRMAPADALHYE